MSAWTTSQQCFLKNVWKRDPENKLNRKKKKSLIGSWRVVPWLPNSGVFITFPLLLTSSPLLLNHDFTPNSSSFPTLLNISHHFSLSHFGFMLWVSCSECYITYLLLQTAGGGGWDHCLLLFTSLSPSLRHFVWKNTFSSPPPTTVLPSSNYYYNYTINYISVYRHPGLQLPNTTKRDCRVNTKLRRYLDRRRDPLQVDSAR